MDAYTAERKRDVVKPQSDHVLEVQLVEHAFVETLLQPTVRTYTAREQDVAAGKLRTHFNDLANLNVTSSRVNQSKRGPHTAALNRLRSAHGLRGLQLHQLARQGAASWLVDAGVWTTIERQMAESYDTIAAAIEDEDDHHRNNGLVASTQETLHETLGRLGIW